MENSDLGKALRPVIVVHGGAGTIQPERSGPAADGVRRATETGYGVLKDNGSAVDAVMEAAMVLEDDGAFNAGYGSSLNIEKGVEMDASIMDGKTLEAGAVALLKDVKNPVRLARIVMEKTDHVFIAGEGANKLADLFNLERRSPVTALRLKAYEDQKKALLEGRSNLPKLVSLINKHPAFFESDTVGAVALDKHGNVAAATSTGGYALKLVGRVGDTPLIGCGNYADNQSGACSATGVGEIAIRLVLAKAVCDRIEDGKPPQEAAEHAIRLVNARIPAAYNSMGVIALDTYGRIGAAHNSPNLCWAYLTPEVKEPVIALTAKMVKEIL
jgi:beta-aspartyl-peptidase (threonine type)